VFLASSNRAKRERYFAYLPPIVSKHHGFIDGPGWSRIAKYAPPHTHRFLYSRAKVGLNLHISDSIDWPSELNERTYILAACGVPQLVDQAKLIERRFSEGSMFVADTPQDYCAMFEHMLTNPAEAGLVALSALEDVFNRHTTFHRADAFLSALQNAGLLKD
jgi:spore maturation protein CgeB